MTQINLKDLPKEYQLLLLTHCSAFSLACNILEQVTGASNSMWANKLGLEALLIVQQMSEDQIEKVLERMNSDDKGLKEINLKDLGN